MIDDKLQICYKKSNIYYSFEINYHSKNLPTAYFATSFPKRRCTKLYKESSWHGFEVAIRSFRPAKANGNLNGSIFDKYFHIDVDGEGNLCNFPSAYISRFSVVGWPFFIGRIFVPNPISSTRANVLAPAGPSGRIVLGPCSYIIPFSFRVVAMTDSIPHY